MNFRTEINTQEIIKPVHSIDYSSYILLFGSCFVEHIGDKLEENKFQTWTNPYGIIFHPLAIEKALHDLINQRVYTQKDLIFDQNLWHSPHHHSDFSNPDWKIVLEKINQNIEKSAVFLKKTSHLVLTLGTAWVYHHIESDQLVANCHKIPQKHFIKRILSVDEISKSLNKIVSLLKEINSNIQIIYTVSPVRHLKDGMQNNTRSKAHLLTAIHQVVDHQTTFYFPSYDILIDDLRDYRFYASDMLHPNETSINYVWELFKNVWMEQKTGEIIQEISQIIRDLNHRPFHPLNENHQKFLNNITKRKTELLEKYGIDFG